MHGYRIHHGRVQAEAGEPFVEVAGEIDGVAVANVHGTTLHGLFEADGFRRAFLLQVAERSSKNFVPGEASFLAMRQARLDRLADLLEMHLDLDVVAELVASAGPLLAGKARG